jgi:hypothetical protein
MHIVRRASRQDKRDVAVWFPLRFTSGWHGLKVADRKSDEFDQSNSVGQVQGHGASVSRP